MCSLTKFNQLTAANRRAIIDHVEALLEAQVRGSNNERTLPLTGNSSGGATWFEAKWITKPSGKRCGPYWYEYGWRNGKRKFVKYHGRTKA